MFKKIQLALLISCISASSYAYVIQTTLTVENKTGAPMQITIDHPNGQEPTTKPIPAHQTTIIDMDNGDHGGLLYQTSTAPFKIKSMGADAKVYAQGRVAYYVGASLWSKYSFLDAVSTADGLKVEPIYSCKNSGYYKNPENKIVIDGTGGNEMLARKFPDKVSCMGLKSAKLDEQTLSYTATCFDGKSTTFWKGSNLICTNQGCVFFNTYSNHDESYAVSDNENPISLKAELDEVVGNQHCGTW